MNIENARELKQRIRAAGPDLPIALGIALTNVAQQFRVSILLTSAADRRLLDCPRVRRAIDSARAEIDVEVMGALTVAGGTDTPVCSTDKSVCATPVLRVGSSIGHHAGGDGSLGFFATRRRDGARGLVSCNHVIALADKGVGGDSVVHPSRRDGGTNAVAALDGNYPRLANRAPADCAFAVLHDGIEYDAGGMFVATPAQLTAGMEVMKAGKVTGSQHGVIAKIEIDNVPMQYGLLRVAFDDVIQIGSTSSTRFARYGDSGSLVYTRETLQPVGLLFATSDMGGPHDAGWTWASPIAHVLDALDVDLIV